MIYAWPSSHCRVCEGPLGNPHLQGRIRHGPEATGRPDRFRASEHPKAASWQSSDCRDHLAKNGQHIRKHDDSRFCQRFRQDLLLACRQTRKRLRCPAPRRPRRRVRGLPDVADEPEVRPRGCGRQ